MVQLGQLWQHKEMTWLRLRATEFREPPSKMILFVVENENDPSTHGVRIDFDDAYIARTYNLIEHSTLSNPAWEV
jgi:hypothetical protein